MAIRAVRPAQTSAQADRPEIKVRARTRAPRADAKPAGQAEPAAKSYKVGYGKPPEHTRFRKGQSGNPKGRPKGAKGLRTLVREQLSAKVTVRTADGPKRITRVEAMLHKITESAFSGNLRALQALFALYQSSVPDEPARSASSGPGTMPEIDMDEHDRAILEMLREQLREERAAPL